MVAKLEAIRAKIRSQGQLKNQLETEIKAKQLQVKEIEDNLYAQQESELHLSEILRLAEIHFPRLRGQPGGNLTPEDLAELDKWVSRAKSIESLKSIVLSIKELSKYYAHDIKTNLYGLVQKIIIEGPYNQKKAVKKT